MSYKSPNKSPSQFIQLSLDSSGSFPDSFTLDSSLLYESPESSPLSVSMEPAESSLALSERSSRFGERERGKGAITFLCFGHGNGFRRYISSDGYPWTLWLKTLRLERGYANIHISPSERLYSDKRPPYVRFNYNGGCHLAHRLVAQFFLNGGEPIPPGMEVDHLDGNRLNNAVSNLEIVTTAENIRRRNVKHGWKHQTAHQRKLKNENNRRRMARLRAQRAAQSSPSSPSSVVPNGTPSSPSAL